MKRVKFISDVATSRGIFPAGSDALLEDVEADSCVKSGQAELVSSADSEPTKPSTPAFVLEKPAPAPTSKKKF